MKMPKENMCECTRVVLLVFEATANFCGPVVRQERVHSPFRENEGNNSTTTTSIYGHVRVTAYKKGSKKLFTGLKTYALTKRKSIYRLERITLADY